MPPPPWILHSNKECPIHPKTAFLNRRIQGGLAHQKCYTTVQPGHSLLWLLLSKIWYWQKKMKQFTQFKNILDLFKSAELRSQILFWWQNLAIWQDSGSAKDKARVDCTEWSACDKKVVTVQLAKNVDRSKDKDKVCDDKKVTLQAFEMHRMLALCPNTTLLSANRWLYHLI